MTQKRKVLILYLLLTGFFGVLFLASHAHASHVTCTPGGDADRDTFFAGTEDPRECDLDDQNQYVNPAVMEGLCTEDLNANKQLDPGEDLDSDDVIDPLASCPSIPIESAWQVSSPSGTKEYANCTDYYTAGNVNPSADLSAPSWLLCSQTTIVSTGKIFYTCVDTRPDPDIPTYLPADVARSVGAKEIDNNQSPGGNEGEPSCPKAGGLVLCGRYADDPVTTDIDESQPCGFCHFFLLFTRIVDWIMKVIIPTIAVGIVAFGGFMLIISRGNPAQRELGKNAIIYTFIGYAVVLVGWLVLNSALAGIGVQKWTGLTGETGNMNFALFCVLNSCPQYQDTDKTWVTDEWKGLVVTMNHNGWSAPKSAVIVSNNSDTLTLEEPVDNEGRTIGGISYTIGGWWQFSCGQ